MHKELNYGKTNEDKEKDVIIKQITKWIAKNKGNANALLSFKNDINHSIGFGVIHGTIIFDEKY